MLSRSSAARPCLALLLAASLVFVATGSGAVPHPSAALEADADYKAARERIRARDFAGALPLLQGLVNDYPDLAEIHSLTGFSLRKLGRFEEAFATYRRALGLDPDPLGANEYLGELYVETGRPDLAEGHLARLRALCGEECDEVRDLTAALAGVARTEAPPGPPHGVR